MAREIYSAAGVITGLATSWQDVIPTAGAGEVILARVRLVNRGTAGTTVRLALWDASAELARILHDTTLAVGEVIEADVRVAPGQRLRALAGAASSIDVSIVHGVRQA